VENIINFGRGIKPVSVGINDLCDDKLAILIVKFLKGSVRFNILKIKLNFVPNTKAYY